jgi:hypothetical protein
MIVAKADKGQFDEVLRRMLEKPHAKSREGISWGLRNRKVEG